MASASKVACHVLAVAGASRRPGGLFKSRRYFKMHVRMQDTLVYVQDVLVFQ
jgi:hypothetical protein